MCGAPSGSGAGSDHEPTVVAARGGADRSKRQANGFAADEPSRRSAGGAKNINPTELVFKWAAQYCGAVKTGGALEADLATDFGTFSPTCGGLAGTEWVRSVAARKLQIRMAPAWEFSVAGKAERRFSTAVFRFNSERWHRRRKSGFPGDPD